MNKRRFLFCLLGLPAAIKMEALIQARLLAEPKRYVLYLTSSPIVAKPMKLTTQWSAEIDQNLVAMHDDLLDRYL